MVMIPGHSSQAIALITATSLLCVAPASPSHALSAAQFGMAPSFPAGSSITRVTQKPTTFREVRGLYRGTFFCDGLDVDMDVLLLGARSREAYGILSLFLEGRGVKENFAFKEFLAELRGSSIMVLPGDQLSGDLNLGGGGDAFRGEIEYDSEGLYFRFPPFGRDCEEVLLFRSPQISPDGAATLDANYPRVRAMYAAPGQRPTAKANPPPTIVGKIPPNDELQWSWEGILDEPAPEQDPNWAPDWLTWENAAKVGAIGLGLYALSQMLGQPGSSSGEGDLSSGGVSEPDYSDQSEKQRAWQEKQAREEAARRNPGQQVDPYNDFYKAPDWGSQQPAD